MNRTIVETIYHKSVEDAISISNDRTGPVAWVWEENMVKNTIKELKYALSVNHHELTLDQITIINETFGNVIY